jgi:hypothetical protein
MNLEYYQRQIQEHSREIARLQDLKARAASDAALDTRRALSADEAASRASSLQTRTSKQKEAQRHRDAAVRYQKKVAEQEGRIAREHVRLADATKRLTLAQSEADRKRRSDQVKADRDHERRMHTIGLHLGRHDTLHRVAMTAIEKLQQLPERITVLFLAANPHDQENLRLDEEARSIAQMIRMSQHRDAVRFESRWALRPPDLLQSINELQPRIVHFSGHGSNDDEILFQDNDGRAKPVAKEAIVQSMAAASGDIQLVVFNTCYSRGQAEAVVKHVAAAIGMKTAIGDDAARVFSAAFYSAIGFGLSVRSAFEQGKAALMLEAIPEESTPELFVTEGLNADDLILVRPPANG